MRVGCWAALALAAVGCGREGKVEDFAPSVRNARTALESALTHWQGGGAHGTVPNTKPAVEVLDSKWNAGQKLKSFEVLSADAPAGGPTTFRVRLTFAQGTPQEVKYAVIGIDPLWVYSDDEFQKLSGAGGK